MKRTFSSIETHNTQNKKIRLDHNSFQQDLLNKFSMINMSIQNINVKLNNIENRLGNLEKFIDKQFSVHKFKSSPTYFY